MIICTVIIIVISCPAASRNDTTTEVDRQTPPAHCQIRCARRALLIFSDGVQIINRTRVQHNKIDPAVPAEYTAESYMICT